jgi:insulysin
MRRFLLVLALLPAGLLPTLAQTPPQTQTQTPSTAQTVQKVPELPPRVVAPTDKAEFRRFVLDNGLRVLLVSDPKFNKSAAALAVPVGQIDDPRDTEGMAHFLEHMLFLGTEKYPEEGEYGRFIRQNGGTQNAYTSSDHTNYHFDIRHEALAGALDRFSQFFIAPTFARQFVLREVGAVHNEAMRHVQNDQRRIISVMRELYDQSSGESKFSTGNKDTLAKATPEAVRAFYERHYSADRMALTIAGRASLDELEQLARKQFAAVPKRATEAAQRAPIFLPRKAALRLARVEPVRELRQLQMEFVLPATRPMFASRADRLLNNVLAYPGPGGLIHRLKALGLANGLSVSQWERTPQYGSLFFNLDLTPQGEKEHQQVLNLLFSWIEFVKRAPFPNNFFQDRARIGALQETYGNRGEGMELVTRLANQALFYPLAVAERADTAWGAPDEAAYRSLLAALVPENMMVALAAKGVPTDKRERIYDVAYSYSEDTGPAFAALKQPKLDPSFALPGANRFMPGPAALLAERAVSLIDEPGLALHYAPDTEFLRPQTAIVMRFVPVRELATLQNDALLALWGRSLQDAIEADLQDAQLAGVSVVPDVSLEGVKLSITGYGNSPAEVAKFLTARLRSFDISGERFAAVHEQTVRALASYPQTEAIRLAVDRREAMRREFRFLPDQLLPVARNLAWPEVQRFGQRLFARGKLEVLVHGHLSLDEAFATARALAAALGAKAAPAQELVRRRHLTQAAGEQITDSGVIEGVNATWVSEHLLGNDSPKLRAASLVLGAFVSPPFYTELRTRQQLGYIVAAQAEQSVREQSILFLIQSSTHSTADVKERAEKVMAGLPAALAAVSDAEWETLKAGARSQLAQQPKSISERAERMFGEAYVFANDWGRAQASLDALKTLTKAEAAALLADTLDPAKARRRTIMLDPKGKPPAAALAATYADRDAWKKGREFR